MRRLALVALFAVAITGGAKGDQLLLAGTLPPGLNTLSITAGRPLSGLRLDRGLLSWLDGGVYLDSALRRFFRPGLGGRARLFRSGCGGFTARAGLGYVLPRRSGDSSWGPRKLSRSANGELGLGADLGLGAACSVALFAEVGTLVDTDFSTVRSQAYLHTVAGVEWAPWRPLSLLAKAGELRGFNGSRTVISGGAALRF